MPLSQKCQYAVRAVFELAKRESQGPVRIADIAEAQAIPMRFLQGILNSLRGSGIVDSTRGKKGGYILLKPATRLTVGEVIEFFEGSLAPVDCLTNPNESCPLKGRCVFSSLWLRAQRAVEEVYDGTTFKNLVEEDAKLQEEGGRCDYMI